MAVYKITDIIACEFLKIPKAMFANETYRRLSSDAKLAYALLYDRLSLSKLNGWINERDEVYLIYTREKIAEDLGITYKKAIAAFRELTEVNLIAEQRCGRGMPNRIYIVKPELDAAEAKKYVKRENLRTADSAHQAQTETAPDMPESPPRQWKTLPAILWWRPIFSPSHPPSVLPFSRWRMPFPCIWHASAPSTKVCPRKAGFSLQRHSVLRPKYP